MLRNSAKEDREKHDKVSLSLEKLYINGQTQDEDKGERVQLRRNAGAMRLNTEAKYSRTANATKCKPQKHLNSIDAIESLLLAHNRDIVAITETWLSPPIQNHAIVPPNYSIIRKDGPSGGGGVAQLIKKSFPSVLLPDVIEAQAVFCRIINYNTAIIAAAQPKY